MEGHCQDSEGTRTPGRSARNGLPKGGMERSLRDQLPDTRHKETVRKTEGTNAQHSFKLNCRLTTILQDVNTPKTPRDYDVCRQ